MLRRLSPFAFATILTVPLSLFACSDDEDDDRPAGMAGRAGSTGTGGSSAGRGGSSAGTAPTAGSGGASAGAPSAAGAGGVAGSGGMGPVACDLSGEGLDREELPANIEADLTLATGKVYEIKGTVWIQDGATLTIPPCTRLEGLSDPDPGLIAALRGGRLVAEGTADAPILFTSSKPAGQRAAGDWGGVVLLGRAPITGIGGIREAIYEGLTDAEYTYGGDDAADDSGVLRYVRIEFSGWEIFPEKEVNGLSMAGVGSGTVIDHVMINNTLDDCFEWWGGSVRGEYLIANNCGDDYFDGDEGWQGGGQYWFGRRDADSIDSDDPNGFELDSINGDFSPRTAFSFSDVTLCGTGAASGRANPQFGMLLRELVTGEIDKLALTGFEYGIDTRNAFEAGDVTIANSSFWGLLSGLGAADAVDSAGAPAGSGNDLGFDDASIFTNDTSNELDPSPAPFTVAQCLADAGPAAAVINSEIGAFPDAAAVEAWNLDGLWVDWSED